MIEVSFTLPLPPSVNKLWRSPPHSRKPIKSTEYRNWLEDAGWAIRAQRVPLTPGRVEVRMIFQRPRGKCDVDNRIKACLDLMTAQGVIEDDDQVYRLIAEWGQVDGCQVSVRPA